MRNRHTKTINVWRSVPCIPPHPLFRPLQSETPIVRDVRRVAPRMRSDMRATLVDILTKGGGGVRSGRIGSTFGFADSSCSFGSDTTCGRSPTHASSAFSNTSQAVARAILSAGRARRGRMNRLSAANGAADHGRSRTMNESMSATINLHDLTGQESGIILVETDDG